MVGVLILLAGSGHAQWRRFGEAREASSPATELLAAHNAVRARVQVPALKWSDRLAMSAQKWADTLLARRQFVHNPNSPFGENLFEVRGGGVPAAQVVKVWAEEAREFDYRANKCRGMCGHYTQIVWRDTAEVGCGVARGGGREVWVCHYDPPGNWVGKRPY